MATDLTPKYQLIPIQCTLLACRIGMNNYLVVLSTWTMVGETLAALRPHNMLRALVTLWLRFIIIVYHGANIKRFGIFLLH